MTFRRTLQEPATFEAYERWAKELAQQMTWDELIAVTCFTDTFREEEKRRSTMASDLLPRLKELANTPAPAR